MTRPDLPGMTVNERLFTLGLLDEWDTAVHARDRAAMLELMQECEVPQPELAVDAVLADPAKYGFPRC